MKNTTEETGLVKPIAPRDRAPIVQTQDGKKIVVSKADRQMAKQTSDDATVLNIQDAIEAGDRVEQEKFNRATQSGIDAADRQAKEQMQLAAAQQKAFVERSGQNAEKLEAFKRQISSPIASIDDAMYKALATPSPFDSPEFAELFQ